MTRNESKILLQKARKLTKEDEEKAIQIYQNIIDMDGTWSVPYYNLGLIYKYSGQWQKSYEFNKKAIALEDKDEAAWWNLGIACTALNKWREARIAWNKFGLELELNDKEVDIDIGSTPVRLLNGTVLWATRICPARAYIDNIPAKESGYIYNDLILIDGKPNGIETVDGVEYSIFDELEIIEKSDYKIYSIGVQIEHPDDLIDLEDRCYEQNYGFENSDNMEEDKEEYNLLIATSTLEELEEVLEEWIAKNDVVVNWIE